MLGCCFDMLVLYYAKGLKLISDEEKEQNNEETIASEGGDEGNEEEQQRLTNARGERQFVYIGTERNMNKIHSSSESGRISPCQRTQCARAV